MKQPKIIIIGGANGSGKTTLALEFIEEEKFTYLGADDIARELNPLKPEDAAIRAARVFSKRIEEYFKKGESLIVESTLSGLSMRSKTEEAKKLGYEVEILFVYLDSPELCVQRVAARVAKGGHNVPEADIRRRFYRANANFWNLYKRIADAWSLFYNSGDMILQVADGAGKKQIVLDEARFLEWERMVKK